VFLQMLNRGDGFTAWQMVTHAPSTIYGSVDASGPGHAGTGDVLDTGTGNDTVYAYGGDDYLKDQGGADLYNGSYGFDTLSYEGWFFKPQFLLRGVDADLALGTVIGPDGLTDRIFGIEAVIGTWKGDALKGNGFANKFSGLAGVDRIDGRGGFDMVSYAADAGQGGTDGIKANLALGTVRDGFGNTDRIISIEGVEGTAARDLFIDSASNTFFDGAAGNDQFIFGSGNDTAIGGRGADLFTFNGTAYDDDTIRDFSPIEGDKINFAAAERFAELHFFAIKVNGVDAVNVQFGSGSVTLLGQTLAGLHAADFGF